MFFKYGRRKERNTGTRLGLSKTQNSWVGGWTYNWTWTKPVKLIMRFEPDAVI